MAADICWRGTAGRAGLGLCGQRQKRQVVPCHRWAKGDCGIFIVAWKLSTRRLERIPFRTVTDHRPLWWPRAWRRIFVSTCTKFTRQAYDKRCFRVVGEILPWHYTAHRGFIFGTRISCGAWGNVFVPTDGLLLAADADGGLPTVDDPAWGSSQALVEARIPFESWHDRQLLDREHSGPIRTLICPHRISSTGTV